MDREVRAWHRWKDPRLIVFASALALVVLIWWHAWVELFQLAFRNDEYSHILLIVPLAAALILVERNAGLDGVQFEWSLTAGGALLAGLLACAWWVNRYGHVGDESVLSLSILALVVGVLSLILLCFGAGLFKAWLYPLLFLLLMVPLSRPLLDHFITFLQSGSTEMSYRLFQLFRVPVVRQGFVLSFPSLDIEVAKECSGIRSTMVLVVAGLVLVRLFLKSAWARALAIMAILPIALFKNAVRIFVLTVLGMYVDPSWLSGRLHHSGGVFFFVLGLVLVMNLVWALRKMEAKTPLRTD